MERGCGRSSRRRGWSWRSCVDLLTPSRCACPRVSELQSAGTSSPFAPLAFPDSPLLASILVGPKAFINKAKWFRKCFGGGIRQSGSLAVAAGYALDHHLPLLPATHALATSLATSLASLGVRLLLPTETQMLWIDPSPLGFTIWELVERAKTRGLRLGGNRIVVHIQVTEEAVRNLVEVVAELKEECKDKAEGLSAEEVEQNVRFAGGQFEGMTAPKKLQRMGVIYAGKK
mgnify:FL=1